MREVEPRNAHRTLTHTERATEIAKMLGGDKVTEAALENARELLGADRN